MVIKKKNKNGDLSPEKITQDFDSIVSTKHKNFFAFDNEEFGAEIRKIVPTTDLSTELLNNIKDIASKTSSWRESPERWSLLMHCLVNYLNAEEKKTANGEGGEEGGKEEEGEGEGEGEGEKDKIYEDQNEPEKDDDAQGDDDDDEVGGGLILRIREEFSLKEKLDDFAVKKLPELPIVGSLFKSIFWIHGMVILVWEKFLGLLDIIAKSMNVENSIILIFKYLHEKNILFRWIVVIFATFLAYGHWIWYGILWPILRWLSDPIGRTMKFLRGRVVSGEGASQNDEPEPEPE